MEEKTEARPISEILKIVKTHQSLRDLKHKTLTAAQLKQKLNGDLTLQEVKMLQKYVQEQIGEDAAASEDGIEIDSLLEVLANMSSPGKPAPAKPQVDAKPVPSGASEEIIRQLQRL